MRDLSIRNRDITGCCIHLMESNNGSYEAFFTSAQLKDACAGGAASTGPITIVGKLSNKVLLVSAGSLCAQITMTQFDAWVKPGA